MPPKLAKPGRGKILPTPKKLVPVKSSEKLPEKSENNPEKVVEFTSLHSPAPINLEKVKTSGVKLWYYNGGCDVLKRFTHVHLFYSTVRSLIGLENAEEVYLVGLKNITDVQPLSKVKSVRIYNCPGVKNIDSLMCDKLDINMNVKLKHIPKDITLDLNEPIDLTPFKECDKVTLVGGKWDVTPLEKSKLVAYHAELKGIEKIKNEVVLTRCNVPRGVQGENVVMRECRACG